MIVYYRFFEHFEQPNEVRSLMYQNHSLWEFADISLMNK